MSRSYRLSETIGPIAIAIAIGSDRHFRRNGRHRLRKGIFLWCCYSCRLSVVHLPGKQLQQLLCLLVLVCHEPLEDLERLCLVGIERLQGRL